MLWVILGILAIVFCCWKFLKPMTYWAEKGVKHEKPMLVFGDTWKNNFQKESYADLIERMYTSFPGPRYSGMYQMSIRTLVVKDPDLIREITVKNFEHFTDHVQALEESIDPLWGKHLFSLKGEKWRDMRSNLSPAFTSSKMKAMFFLMSDCAEQFVQHFEKTKIDINTIELRDTFSRFTNDVIATCAFGIKCDSLGERDNEFFRMGKEAVDFSSLSQMINMIILQCLPKLAKLLGITLFKKTVSKFFTNLVSDAVQFREAKNIIRPDMIHLLMEARKGRLVYEEQHSKDAGFATVEESDIGKFRKATKTEITLTDMTAQALIFFLAGFDSVATLLCYIGYELGINPDIQERLIQEVDKTLSECNGKITYEALNNMKYLDMVVAETMRKWPPATASDRRCVIPYTIQPKNSHEQPLTLEKDDAILLPIWGIHRDPKFYPNPEKFDPERFSDQNKSNIKPYTYMPFGAGPRNCIGSRFALLETKIVYFKLLSKFEIVPVEKTQIPLKLSKKGFNMNAENGFWLGLKKRIVN